MTMDNNKLIAEFMGYDVKHGKCYSPKYNDGTIAPMQFDRSWDWLMPVVHRIKEQSRYRGLVLEIGLPIEYVYEKVVEYIKEYNVDNADTEDDACDMLYGVDNNQ